LINCWARAGAADRTTATITAAATDFEFMW
jgi:hypothetical protein